jgi:MATE family multidrug resistance protein
MLLEYSGTSMRAAISAGLSAFMMAGIFIGLAGYASVMVALASGAGKKKDIGPLIWQSIFISLLSGLAIALFGLPLSSVFSLFGHAGDLATEESVYFRILTLGAVFSLANTSLMCFWTGRGRTWTVVLVNILSILGNIFLNLLFIRGLSFPYIPAMGITGAGLATVASDVAKSLILFRLFLAPANRDSYCTLPRSLLRPSLLKKFIRPGLACGLQSLLSVGTLVLFNLLAAGALTVEGSLASSAAFTLNAAVQVPLLGLSAALAMLVGHGLGARDLGRARLAVGASLKLALIYSLGTALIFIFFPEALLSLAADRGKFPGLSWVLAASLLGLSSVFFAIEGLSAVLSGALRGAGDAAFSMWAHALSFFFFIPLSILACSHSYGPRALWIILSASGALKAISLLWRARRLGLLGKGLAGKIRPGLQPHAGSLNFAVSELPIAPRPSPFFPNVSPQGFGHAVARESAILPWAASDGPGLGTAGEVRV